MSERRYFWQRPSGLLGLLACAIFLILAVLSPKYIPYSMDEFIHYHPIGCYSAPLSLQYQVYNEGCHEYALQIPHTPWRLPLRSYLYVGSVPNIPFYFFWRVLQDPIAVRVQGAVFFAIAVYLSARFLKVSVWSALLASLIFPVYFTTFIVDTGPAGISILLLLITLLCLDKAFAADKRHVWKWGIAAGLATFLGLYTKLVFAWYLPALIVFAFYKVRFEHPAMRDAVKRAFWPMLGFVVIIATFLIPILLAKDADGVAYYHVTQRGGISFEHEAIKQTIQRMGVYVTNASDIMPRIIQLPAKIYDIWPAILTLILAGFGILRLSKERNQVLLYCLHAVLVFDMMIINQSAWAPHHVILVLVFVVLATALVIEPIRLAKNKVWIIALIVLIAGYWATIFYRLPKATVSLDTNTAKDELLQMVHYQSLDTANVQMHTSWGTYYIANLFGARDRAVLFSYTFAATPTQITQTRTLANMLNRGILVYTFDPVAIKNSYYISSLLGQPVKEYTIGNWTALQYLR